MEAMNLTEHSLLATFDDPARARRAVEELGRAGIEADEMSMGGGGMEKAGGDAGTSKRDAATGGAIGLVVAGLVTTAVLLIAGGSLGFMLAGVRKLPLTDEWELTYDEDASRGPVKIAVHAADEKTVQRARKVLESEHPDQLEQLGPNPSGD